MAIRHVQGEQAGLTVELVQAVRAMHALFADKDGGMTASAIKKWSRTINGTHSAEALLARTASGATPQKPPEKDAAADAVDAVDDDGDDAVKGVLNVEVEKAELEAMIAAWVAEGYRGSPEFRQALTLLQRSAGGLANGVLSADGLIAVYGVLIRDGKFWYVEHDVAKLGVWPEQQPTRSNQQRKQAHPTPPFEASFDYIFYDASRLELQAVRRPLTEEQRMLVYDHGERLPCAWHMSDHLPVAASFKFRTATS